MQSGNHTIAAPITLAGNLLTSIWSGGTLTLTSDLSAGGATLTKSGAGTLAVKNATVDQLAIVGGTVRVTPNGSPGGASRVRLLTINAGAKLDLADNDLIVSGQPVGTLSGAAYTGVTGLIQAGRNGGNWNGSGIVSSSVSGSLTTLGIASASQVKGINPTDTAVWNGQTVTGTDTLVMYTYGGDANLDGKINVDDYGRIDFSVPLGITGWFNGDFNYDGKVNIDDYGIIDFNVGIQGPSLGSAFAALPLPVTAVPEPVAVLPISIALVFTARRRRNTS